MDYQQMSLFDEQESDKENLHAFQGASPASLTALQEAVKRLVMNVIYGRSTGESLAKLDQNGLWLKMYGDYFQANLEGFFEEYSEIFPTWGMMLDGVVTELPMSEQFTPESVLQLLPTPLASDATVGAVIGKNDTFKMTKSGKMRKFNQQGTNGSLGLTRTLKLLPTPTANLEKGYSPGSAKKKQNGIKHRDSGAMIGSGLNNEKELLQYYQWEGQNLLNPLFVEAMMGFPERWTEISV